MLPGSAESLESTVRMFDIIKQTDVASGYETDITEKYLLLMMFKLGLDVVTHYLCSPRRSASFVSVCSLSIILCDVVMVVLLATMWFLGSERYLASLCLLLAEASAIYDALPLPVIFLVLLEYRLDVAHLDKQGASCKLLRNAVFTLLVWSLAAIYANTYVTCDLIEMDQGSIKTVVCEVKESGLINYLIMTVFTAVVCALLPFWSKIPLWVKEADRLSVAREEQENQSSDLVFTSTKSSQEEPHPEEPVLRVCPPLWFSLTLGFSMIWMPYLVVSVVCMLFGLSVPAYVTVNLLWLECSNSLLSGVTFWANSDTQGPYSRLPENVCMWHIYWHLSRGQQQQQQQQQPIAVFNPSKEKRNTLFYL